MADFRQPLKMRFYTSRSLLRQTHDPWLPTALMGHTSKAPLGYFWPFKVQS